MQGALTLHASCVGWQGRGVLIIGSSGSGKSTLALKLMAYGADLVADDRTMLSRNGDGLRATCPHSLAGMIEARCVGLLNAASADAAELSLVVDLDHIEEKRLPPQRSITYIGVKLPLIYGTGAHGFAAAVLQMLKAGRSA